MTADPNLRNGQSEVPLARKIAFLSSPETYGGATDTVEARETHMSWVFLTSDRVHKLKKPIRRSFLDYSTLERRAAMCREEVRVNRRLASWVYLGVERVALDPQGELSLNGEGEVVEWLVVMRRLPEERMLDSALRSGMVDSEAAKRTLAHLIAFYQATPAVPRSPGAYAAGLRQDVATTARELREAGAAETAVAGPASALLALVGRRGALLQARVDQGRLRDGHGDLRPEHVFLGTPPALIDAIEFSAELRRLDPLDELSYLAMECAFLGDPSWGLHFIDFYALQAEDDVPEELVRFHMARRAMLRAKLALWHLRDEYVSDPAKWRQRAEIYLDLANDQAAHLV